MSNNKFGAKATTRNGYSFDSLVERDRWQELELWQAAGGITALTHHPVYALIVHEILICRYEADSSYQLVDTEEFIVEDVKSNATVNLDTFRIKRALMLALLGITVRIELRNGRR